MIELNRRLNNVGFSQKVDEIFKIQSLRQQSNKQFKMLPKIAIKAQRMHSARDIVLKQNQNVVKYPLQAGFLVNISKNTIDQCKEELNLKIMNELFNKSNNNIDNNICNNHNNGLIKQIEQNLKISGNSSLNNSLSKSPREQTVQSKRLNIFQRKKHQAPQRPKRLLVRRKSCDTQLFGGENKKLSKLNIDFTLKDYQMINNNTNLSITLKKTRYRNQESFNQDQNSQINISEVGYSDEISPIHIKNTPHVQKNFIKQIPVKLESKKFRVVSKLQVSLKHSIKIQDCSKPLKLRSISQNINQIQQINKQPINSKLLRTQSLHDFKSIDFKQKDFSYQTQSNSLIKVINIYGPQNNWIFQQNLNKRILN